MLQKWGFLLCNFVPFYFAINITKAYGQLATTYYDYFGTGIIVAVIYFLLGLPFVRLARWTEKKMAVAVKGGKTQKNSNSFVGKKPGSY